LKEQARQEAKPEISLREIREMSEKWPVDSITALSIAARVAGYASSHDLRSLMEYSIRSKVIEPKSMKYKGRSKKRSQRAFSVSDIHRLTIVASHLDKDTVRIGFAPRKNQLLFRHAIEKLR